MSLVGTALHCQAGLSVALPAQVRSRWSDRKHRGAVSRQTQTARLLASITGHIGDVRHLAARASCAVRALD